MKRALKALERERMEREARVHAVFSALWADPKYVRLHERKDRLNRALTQRLNAPHLPLSDADLRRGFHSLESLRAAFHRANQRIIKRENAALAAAGLTP